ncbi:MAG TPA: hypothetical protein DFS52_20265 [Myxococcales bacterium]|nr:hypothetical protein [Myxococcales bacterium]
MKKILSIFVIGFACAAGLFGALNYHFIRTSKKLVIERKAEMGFKDTFVDTREWGPIDYLKNPGVANVLARGGLKDLLGDSKDASKKAEKEAKRLIDEGQKAIGDALEEAGKKLKK